MKKLFIIIALMLIYSISANAQYLWVVGNNSNGYPIIKSEVKLFDKDSAQELRDPVIANWTVVENGKLRKINKITCPDATGKFSIILVIDRSMSMSSFNIGNDFRIEVAKKTAIKWVTKLFNEYLGNFECSLMQFSTGTRGVEPWVKLLVPFTETNKDTLLKCINLIKTTGGTDFNAAFLWDCDHNPGAMLVAKQAKYLPIVVFITDGAHAPNECKDVWNPSDFRSDMVIEYAHKNKPNVIIYSLFMDNPSVPIPDDLTTLASGTNGKTYQGFTTEDQITDALNDILDEAGKNPIYPPCVIEWETACDGGAATFTNLPTSATYTLNYTVDPKLKPYLEINPRDYLFLNQGTGDKTFTITARNNYVDLTGFTSDPRFSIVDPPQLPPRLEKGQSLTITIRYTSTDSNLAVSNFMLTGSACDSNWINASAGFRFCRIIDMGFNKLTDPEKCDTKVAFCNYTNKDVIISSPRIEGGANPDEFRVKDVQGGYLVKAGECKIIEFCFSPKVTGRRSSFFRTEVDGVLYEAEIFGEGGGKPAIEGLPITMPNVDCSNPSYDSLVVIKNTGADILT
ncbi:MAG: Choice-of-anchor protein, partial [Bacteroidota bacterium]|nr:Choice-of-anchor protein [Bacteroidota bacterium]